MSNVTPPPACGSRNDGDAGFSDSCGTAMA